MIDTANLYKTSPEKKPTIFPAQARPQDVPIVEAMMGASPMITMSRTDRIQIIAI